MHESKSPYSPVKSYDRTPVTLYKLKTHGPFARTIRLTPEWGEMLSLSWEWLEGLILGHLNHSRTFLRKLEYQGQIFLKPVQIFPDKFLSRGEGIVTKATGEVQTEVKELAYLGSNDT